MRSPTEFVRIIGRTRYDVSKSTLLASDAYWDGHNFERCGRNLFLYKTPRGAFFLVALTQWQDEQDALEPIAEDTAIELFEGPLSHHEMSYAEAFPDVQVLEA